MKHGALCRFFATREGMGSVSFAALLCATSIGMLSGCSDQECAQSQWVDALRSGKGARVSECIEAGIDINGLIPYDESSELEVPPLVLAVESANVLLVLELLESGADPNLPASNSRTPIYWAIEHRDSAGFEVLLEAGAEVDVRDSRGVTPLIYAVRNGTSMAMHELLERGADPNAREKGDWTALHSAASRGDVKIVEALLQYGADTGAEGQTGRTPFMNAAMKSQLDVMETLVRNGVDPSAFSSDRVAGALSAAALSSSGRKGLEWLIAWGVDPNLPGYAGRTALHDVALYGSPEVLRFLLEAGADPQLETEQGDTALDFAKKRSDQAGKEINEILQSVSSLTN